jgi:hypothetical protein
MVKAAMVLRALGRSNRSRMQEADESSVGDVVDELTWLKFIDHVSDR